MIGALPGVRLVLWAGQMIPRPAPPEVLDALTRIEVTNDAKQGDGFQLTVQLSKNNPADYGIIQGGALDPMTRVIIAVLIGASLDVLIDGVITQHQLTPSEDPGKSTLTVTGRDTSVMLGLDDRKESYAYHPDSAIVERLLLSYIPNGLIGPHMIAPTFDIPIDVLRTPQQPSTDLKYIQALAERNGFVFYVQPVTFGVTSAYWGPEIRGGFPQPALTLNMGADTNLRSISFTNDALAPMGAKATFIEPFTKMTIPVPAVPPLRIPPLSLFPSPAHRTKLLAETANKGIGEALIAVLAAATSQPDSVTGQGEIDTIRYGHVLRARGVVGVRGVGFSYDGLYYVTRVSHTLTLGDYKQSFALSREGTGSLLPVLLT